MNFSQWGNPDYWILLLYRIPAVLLALSVHEMAHAYAAYKCGDPTAKNLGRLSFDPLKHLDPIGTIMLFLVGFGWAKPVPVNPRNFKHYKRDNILVSVSGVIANFILSFIAAGILFFTYFVMGIDNMIYVNIMYPIITLNISLGIFNLIPIPPLDGFSLISTFMQRKAAGASNFLRRYGYIILLVLVFTGAIGVLLGNLISLITEGYSLFFSLFVPGVYYL